MAVECLEILIGPIIRVNPDELSIHDPDAYNEIYVTESKRRTNNHQPFSQGIGFDGEVAGFVASMNLPSANSDRLALSYDGPRFTPT